MKLVLPKFAKLFARKKKLKRVCFLNPQGYLQYPAPLGKTDTGGQTLYVLQLAKALGKKGIKVDIFHRRFENLPEEESPFENVRIIRLPAGGPGFLQKEKMYEVMPEFTNNILTYAKENRLKYNVIHSHYWDGGYAGLRLSRKLKIPHVFTPHSLGKLKELHMELEKTPVQKLRPVYRYQVRIAAEQRILHDANAITLLSETTRIRLLERYLVDFEKLHVIYPGIDTSIFQPIKNGVDKKVQLEPNSILTVSRLVNPKGLDRVLDALNLLKGKISFHLYMGGGGNGEDQSEEEKVTQQQLLELIKKYGLTKQVTFLGFIPHDSLLPAYYRAADIFILAGRYEPFGLTTLEAMACGATPLVSDVAGSREVIVDGLNGYVLDMHDRKKLAEKIQTLLADVKLNKKISQNAAFTIKENYSWDTIVVKFVTLYKNLL